MRMNITPLPILVHLLLMLTMAPAHAHKVNVFATIEDGNIKLEGYFPDGKKAKGAKVSITDEKGDTIIEGEADQDGKFTAPLLATGKILVSIDVGLGHRSDTTIEVQSGSILTQQQAEHQHDATSETPSPVVAAKAPTASVQQPMIPAPNPEQMQKSIEQAVRSAVIPLERRLLEYERSTGMREIIGGLGYLMGLFGTVMYFQARRQKNPNDYG